MSSSHSRATHDRGVQALETYAELTALAPRGAGRVHLPGKASLCEHPYAPGRVLCHWAPCDAHGRIIHRKGSACCATGIASDGLPALSGRVLGTSEATVPRSWGGGGAHVVLFVGGPRCGAPGRKEACNFAARAKHARSGVAPRTLPRAPQLRPTQARGKGVMATLAATAGCAQRPMHRSRAAFNSIPAYL